MVNPTTNTEFQYTLPAPITGYYTGGYVASGAAVPAIVGGCTFASSVVPEAYNAFKISTKELAALRSIQWKLHNAAKVAGWHDKPREFGTGIALIHSEVSEALEGYRKGLKDDHLPTRPMPEVEFADAIIRIFDEAGLRGFDVGGALAEKFEYNQNRADHKKENREKEGGKKF